MVVIPFNLPKIGAETAAECEAFQILGALRKKASAAIGWAISLGKKFRSTGVMEINTVLLPKLHPKLKGLEPRLITGYSILLYFIDQVHVHFACIHEHDMDGKVLLTAFRIVVGTKHIPARASIIHFKIYYIISVHRVNECRCKCWVSAGVGTQSHLSHSVNTCV